MDRNGSSSFNLASQDYRNTFIVITKDRPQLVRQLIKSLGSVEDHSISLVLIDDSHSRNFRRLRSYLKQLSLPHVHLSSLQARGLVETALKQAGLDEDHRHFVKYCTGINSPFPRSMEQLARQTNSHRRFGPYSPARNLGVFLAIACFNPEVLIFLDDDCKIPNSDQLVDELKLLKRSFRGKVIVAIGGIYEESGLTSFAIEGKKTTLSRAISMLQGMDGFLKKSLATGEDRLSLKPTHLLGGALILSKAVFYSLPFDPFVPRGEDHTYALDLATLLKVRKRKETFVRDRCFVVGHIAKSGEQTHLNYLRDVFRFMYCRAKTGRSFIRFLVIRWTMVSLLKTLRRSMPVHAWKEAGRELSTLVVGAPCFAKLNALKFKQNLSAWKTFLLTVRSHRQGDL
jgi:hypothetical protein